jgi:hypothetical protein
MKKLFSVTPELSTRVIKETQSFLEDRQDIQFAFLYGSFVEVEVFHDIDLGLFLEDRSLDRRTDIAFEVSEQLSLRLQLPVDVRVLNGAPVSFLFHVIRGRLVFCRDAERVADHIEYVLPRYFDRRDFLRHYTREAFSR